MVVTRRLRSEAMKGGPARAPNRSYLRAMGLSDEDIQKPFVAVANCWNEATPCNEPGRLLSQPAIVTSAS